MKTFFQSRLVRRGWIIVGGLVFIYVLVYSGLSMAGCYQPIAVGIGHVETYAWAPLGFYDPDHAWRGSVYAVRHPTETTGGWGRLMFIFHPLWLIDARYVHPYRQSNAA